MEFFETLWHGEAIGDGGDEHEALVAYGLLDPLPEDWAAACAEAGAEPQIQRYASFEAYLDNADALETLPVTAAMIERALAEQI